MAELTTYKTPGAFKAALAERIRSRAKTDGVPTDRARSLAVMERFLARVVAVFPATTVLKGGLALELSLDRARSTKDIDLRLLGEPAAAGGAGLAAGGAGLAAGAAGGAAAGAAVGALLGPVGMLIGGGLGAYAARALSSSRPGERAEVSVAAKRLAAGRRVFAELQGLRQGDPRAFRREVDHLFTELVEDSDVAG